MLTDYAGATVQSCASLPFGNGENCPPTPTEQLFTQKQRDVETGNDYFGARYYSSLSGRFLTPDWSAKVEPVPYAKLDNPQSLNLYAYVGNNPLSGTDPDGHFGFGFLSGLWAAITGNEAGNLTGLEEFAAVNLGGTGEQQQNTEVAQEEAPEAERDIEENLKARENSALEPVKPGESVTPSYDWMNPGPLSEDVAKTFAGGRYSKVVVGDKGFGADALYHVYGGRSPPVGKDGTFYSPIPQRGGIQSQIDLALRPEWGNTAQNVICVYLKPGTVMYVGTAASQGGFWVGGTPQIYVPNQ